MFSDVGKIGDPLRNGYVFSHVGELGDPLCTVADERPADFYIFMLGLVGAKF